MEATLGNVRAVLEKTGELLDSNLALKDEDFCMGATIDTRDECSCKIFFALKGGNADGHDYVLEAGKKGSSAVVVESASAVQDAEKSSLPYFKVKDSLTAMQKLAGAYRKNLRAKTIAITGSSGKTTTREMIKSILSKNSAVHSNPANYNNHIGVPLTILNTCDSDRYLVSEIGANHSGEIEFLCSILKPDAGVITNTGAAHVGYFGSEANIASAKAEMLEYIPAGGWVVLPADDKYIDFYRGRAVCQITTFGSDPESGYRMSDYRMLKTGSEFSVNARPISAKFYGRHNALNAAAALAVADKEGVEFDSAADAINGFEPLEGRGRVYKLRDMVILDESYNANPSSMEAAVDVLAQMDAKRRVAVMGDMKELGVFAAEYHRKLGEYLGSRGIDLVIWQGDEAEFVKTGLESTGEDCLFKAVDNVNQAARVLIADVRREDAILIKGSHSCELIHVVRLILDEFSEKGGN